MSLYEAVYHNFYTSNVSDHAAHELLLDVLTKEILSKLRHYDLHNGMANNTMKVQPLLNMFNICAKP